MSETYGESRAINSIENYYMTEERNSIYIALEELNFVWSIEQVEYVVQLYKEGWDIRFISNRTMREVDEVAVLLIDLCRKRKIQPRAGGVFGDYD